MAMLLSTETETLPQTAENFHSTPEPPPLPEPPRAPEFIAFKLAARRMTFGEWWRSAPVLGLLFGVLAKLRVPLLDDLRLAIPRHWGECEVSAEALPEVVRAAGFGAPVFLRFSNPYTRHEAVLAVLPHAGGLAFARVCLDLKPGASAKTARVTCSYHTAASDGRFLCWDENKGKLVRPTGHTERQRRARKFADLWPAYEKAAREFGSGAGVRPVGTAVQALSVFDSYEHSAYEFHRARGLYVPLAAAEGPAAPSGDPVETAVLEELRRMQTSRGGSLAGVALLLVSLAASAGIGGMQWTWGRTALILGVLFVHEVGHYVAMRVFKYRELRMFFIPLFGAAVSGRHHNVPGWRKAVVSLMGPVPGIVAGAVLAIYASVNGRAGLAEAAFFLIFLNAFNLLPILPLDGGWFWNAVLFCRHRWLEATFQTVAGLAGVAASAAGGGRIWLYLGLAMLLRVPVTLRLGAVAGRLRRGGWQAAADGDETLSAPTAGRIFQELQSGRKTPAGAKVLARETLDVFEKLNARAPNWLEALGLSAIYFGTLLVAVVGLGFAVMSSGLAEKFGGAKAAAHLPERKHVPVLTADFAGETQESPVRENESATAESAAEEDEDEPRVGRPVFVMFDSAEQARAAYADLAKQLRGEETAAQFGPAVIASVPYRAAKRTKEITAQLRAGGGRVVNEERTGIIQLDLAATAPDAETAERIGGELAAYVKVPAHLRPPAPWSTASPSAPEQRAAMTKAAATYGRVLESEARVGQSPTMQRLLRRSQIDWIFHRKKTGTGLGGELQAERERLRREAIGKLQGLHDPALDPRVLALALEQPAWSGRAGAEALQQWNARLRQLLGGGEKSGETPADFAIGTVRTEGARVVLTEWTLSRPERTLPALGRYLAAQSCTGVRFGFYDAMKERGASFSTLAD